MVVRSTLSFAFAASAAWMMACSSMSGVEAFAPAVVVPSKPSFGIGKSSSSSSPFLRMAAEGEDDFVQETPENTQKRIQSLVDENPVMLFMKGSKLFPQCGFSNTACQILMSYGIEFETADVLADNAIRSGVKEFSQWPTIPQLYVGGEFIGGSDIMIELYQSGELGEMIEKIKADMV
eukprot:CAMPEP_0195270438 /NCGR_PEP_ID=MMETSP0706-20130129/14355_1 /TAXON_ID=33640 /ORGANISM="Asterionellopsis glacialis, Strain CCMP134" /LENGTH=177 /DNA_ID=CAMNT_0040325719 /DNA_START=27 /DNA_END=560 /DNA_ORIENTATION=-